MTDGGRTRESGAGAAQRLGNAGVTLREAADVELVDDGARPRHPRAPGRRGGRRVRDDGLRHHGGAVAVVGPRPSAAVPNIAACSANGRSSACAYGSTRSFAGLKRWPRAGSQGPVRAQSVARPRAEAGHERVEHVTGALRQRDALDLALALRVEHAELDGVRVRREHRDVDAVARRHDAEDLGLPDPNRRVIAALATRAGG